MESISVVGGGLSGLLFGYWVNKNSPHLEINIYEKNRSSKVDCAEGLTNLRGQLTRLKKEGMIGKYERNSIKKANFKINDSSHFCRFNEDFYIIDREEWQKDLEKKLKQNDVVFRYEKISSFDELGSDFVVDASGAKQNYKSAIYAVYETKGIEKPNQVVFEFKREMNGYCWLFPKSQEKANIGVLDNNPKKKHLRKWKSKLEEQGLEFEKRIKMGGGSLDPSYIKSDIKLLDLNKNIAKIGDAAGLADPFFGEGIEGVVSSSYNLAKCISDNKIEEYPKKIKKENQSYLKKSNKMDEVQRNDFDRFKKSIKSIDGLKASVLTDEIKLLLNHPIKAFSLIKNLYIPK